MPVAVLRRAWQGKPPVGAQINWGHPLARGLVFATLLTGGVPRDLVTGYPGALNGGAVSGVTLPHPQHAVGVDLDGVDDYVAWANGRFNVTTHMSIVTAFRLDGAGSDIAPFVISKGLPGSSIDWGLGGNATSPPTYLRWVAVDGNFDLGAIGTSPITAGEWFHAAGTFMSTTATLYKNGVAVASGTPLATVLVATAGSTLELGRRQSAGVQWNGAIAHAYMYGRALMPSEISWLAAEPYVFIAPPSPTRFYAFRGPVFQPAWARPNVYLGGAA